MGDILKAKQGNNYIIMTNSGSGYVERLNVQNAGGFVLKNSSDVQVGSITNSGSWTAGPSSFASLDHTVQGNRLTIDSTGTTSDAGIGLYLKGSGSTGQPQVRGSIETDSGSIACLRFDARTNADAAITTRPLFAWNNKATVVGNVSAAGAWALGIDGNASNQHTVYGNRLNIWADSTSSPISELRLTRGTSLTDIYTDYIFRATGGDLYFIASESGSEIDSAVIDNAGDFRAINALKVGSNNNTTKGIQFRDSGSTYRTMLHIDGNDGLVLRPGKSTNGAVYVNNFANSNNNIAFHDSGNVELFRSSATIYLPRASDAARIFRVYSPTGSILRITGDGSGSGQVEIVPSSSSSVSFVAFPTGSIQLGNTAFSGTHNFYGASVLLQRSTTSTVSIECLNAGNGPARFFADCSTATGDAYMLYRSGGELWSTGIDNSDSQNFKLTNSLGPSGGTEIYECSSSTGSMTIKNAVYLPGIGSGAGTYPVKWNTFLGELSYDTSSRLEKEDITDVPYGLLEVMQMSFRKFKRKSSQAYELGQVADELVGICPELVPMVKKSLFTKEESDAELIPGGVHYDKLTAVLGKAIQEIKEEKDAEIKARDSIIADLVARVEVLEAS